MNEQRKPGAASSSLPEAVISTRKSFSIVWLVPMVAIFIGGWLVYKALSEKGPMITITFRTAEGVEAGKTKIQYKDVEIGKVESVRLSEDLSKVILTAEIVRGVKRYLTDSARFWVVRARVSAGEVSGLRTLFSGAYIAMDPGKGGTPLREFEGLERPPVITAADPGLHFLLKAEKLGSLEVGSPVYFRQIKVGQVESYGLDEYNRAVDIKVFINEPHHKMVRKNTRFWNAGGLDVSLDASGVRVDTQSIVSLMIGGIAFETPMGLEPGDYAKEGDVFTLYKNYHAARHKHYQKKHFYVLNFGGSVRGLSPGSPVEFRGIKIGQVLDVSLKFDLKRWVVGIPVLVEIEPERIVYTGELPTEKDRKKLMDALVARGLRAQLQIGSLITGKLFVEMDFHPKAPVRHIKWEGKYPELPTVPAPIEEISANLAKFLDKLQKLPLEEIGSDVHAAVQSLDDTLKQTRMLVQKLNANVEPEATAALAQAQKTLASVENALNPDSPLYYEARRALTELADAVRAIHVLADYLERHPDSLIYGKGNHK
jgi:paraquat-inducible protein B